MGWDMGGRGEKDGWSRALAGGSCLSQQKPPRLRARAGVLWELWGLPPTLVLCHLCPKGAVHVRVGVLGSLAAWLLFRLGLLSNRVNNDEGRESGSMMVVYQWKPRYEWTYLCYTNVLGQLIWLPCRSLHSPRVYQLSPAVINGNSCM